MAKIHDMGGNDDQGQSGPHSGGQGGFHGQGGHFDPSMLGVNINMGQTADEPGVPDVLTDFNQMAKDGKFEEALFRDKQIGQVLTSLRLKKKPNPLLIGEAGTGKTQIVEEIARRLCEKDPVVVDALGEDAVIYELPLANIVSGSSLVGQLEEKLMAVIDWVKDPDNNAILFIDEIHQLSDTGHGGTSQSYETMSQIIKRDLSRGELRVIGATTTQEAKTLMDDPAFSRRFSEVLVPELSVENTEHIIESIRESYANHHGVILHESLVADVVAIGDKHKRYGSHRPDSAITLLDRAMADARVQRAMLKVKSKGDAAMEQYLKMNPKAVITKAQLEKSALTLLVGDDTMYQRTSATLAEELDKYIIGQDDAKTAVVDAVRRLALNITPRKRPVSFMLAGPSGTGKTEIAKQIAKAIYGSEDALISLNMTEYTNEFSLSQIIGSPKGVLGSNSKQALPFDSLQTNPYQIVLLDEFEKAHGTVRRFFMKALDEGKVMDMRGQMIDFSRTIVIATTNAGAGDMSKPQVGFGAPEIPNFTEKDIVVMLQQYFENELINRFEHIIGFNALTRENYTQILAIKYNAIVKGAMESRKDLTFTPEHIDIEDACKYPALVDLANKTYNPELNGRPAERSMLKFIEDSLIANTNATQHQLI